MDSVLKVNKRKYSSKIFKRYEQFLIQEKLMNDICWLCSKLKNETFIKYKSEYEIEILRVSMLKRIEKYYNIQEELCFQVSNIQTVI